MKYSLPLAVLALACTTTASAQTTPTISGIMDAAVRSVRNDGAGSLRSMVSGSNSNSRIAFRGAEDLGNGLSASFWLEHGIAVDSGASTTANFWDRRSTVSLSSKTLGELRLGRDFVPSYLAWSRFDPFAYVGVAGANNPYSNTQTGPIRSAFGSGANTTVRSSNAVQYWLPANLGGLEGQLMAAPGEGGSKVYGGRLGYTVGPVMVAGAYTVTETPLTVATGKFKDSAIGGTYSFGGPKVSLAARQLKQADAKQTNLLVSTVVPVGAGEIKASYIRINMSGSVSGTSIGANDAQQLGLGYVHNLSKRTALYAQAARISNDGSATFTIPGGPAATLALPAGITAGGKSTGYEAGLRHTF